MRYIPNSPAEQAALLREVGAASVDDLFATVPREVFRKDPPPLAPPMSEIELRRTLGAMAVKNAAATCFASFLGAASTGTTLRRSSPSSSSAGSSSRRTPRTSPRSRRGR